MSSEWFDQGLRFTCTQCGNCCTGPPGYVWFDDEEAEAMAEQVGLGVDEFRRRYARQIDGRWTLEENCNERGEYDCVFLITTPEGKRTCSSYSTRPLQCRTWPFWPENVRSKRNWRQVARTCPGVKDGLSGEGQLHSVEQIRIVRDRHK